MDLFRRSRRRAVAETIAPTLADERVDLIRFERLIETSIRLRDSGVDYESIEHRASADNVTWNEALEAVDRERSQGEPRLQRQGGAAAVEFALIAPVLFMILFGILEFGVAFLQVQSMRTAVREGGREAAVGAEISTVQQKTVDASSGSIPDGQEGNIDVDRRCTPQQIGEDVIVSYDTAQLPDGGVIVRIPFIPEIHMTPVISASFRCEA